MRFLLLLALCLIAFNAAAQSDPVPRSAEEADQRDLDELTRAQQKMADQYKALNPLNPLGDARPGALNAANLPAQLQWLKPWLENPALMERGRRLGQLVTDPVFAKSSAEIVQNPNLKWLSGAVLAFFVFYVLLKRRVLASSDRWWVRLFLRVGLAGVFFFGQFLISYAFLGQPLIELIWGLKKVFV